MVSPGQEYWSGLPFSSPGDLPDPGMEPMSPALQADSIPLSQRGSQPPIRVQNLLIQGKEPPLIIPTPEAYLITITNRKWLSVEPRTFLAGV